MVWTVAWIDGFISLNLAVSLPSHSIVHTFVCNKFKSPLVFAVCMMILLFTLGSLQKGEKIGPLIQLFIQNINPPLIFSIFNITCIFTVLLFGIAHYSTITKHNNKWSVTLRLVLLLFEKSLWSSESIETKWLFKIWGFQKSRHFSFSSVIPFFFCHLAEHTSFPLTLR